MPPRISKDVEYSYRVRYMISLTVSSCHSPIHVLGTADKEISATKGTCIVFPTTILKESDLISEKSSDFLFSTFFMRYPEYRPSCLQHPRQLVFSYQNYVIRPHDTHTELVLHSSTPHEHIDYVPLVVHFNCDKHGNKIDV